MTDLAIYTLNGPVRFTAEFEEDKRLNFLDICIVRLGNRFNTSVYVKPSHCHRTIHPLSCCPKNTVVGVLNTMRVRAWNLCSDIHNAHVELTRLENLFTANGHKRSFVRKHLFYPTYGPKIKKEQLAKCFIQYHPVTEIIGHVLRRNHIDVVYKSDTKLGSLIQARTAKVDPKERTGVVYMLNCANCESTYVGQTSRSLTTRFNEHVAAAKRNDIAHSAMSDHICTTDHSMRLADTTIIYQDSDRFSRLVKETIAIKHFQSQLLSQNVTSVQISPHWFDILSVHDIHVT